MNPRIFSTSPTAAFGIHFTKEHQLNFEEIDERLFDTQISGNKNSIGVPTHRSLSSADGSSAEDEESDSSAQKLSNIIGSGRHSHKNRSTASARKTKSHKKEDVAESDNDSLHDFNNKNSKKSVGQNKRLSVTTSTSSVTSQDSNENDKKQKSLYKTELCRNWEETSHCRYGMKCQYAHGAADLRSIDRHPKYKTQKCRTFHQTGACPYGARCTFRHFNLPGDALEMKNLDKQEEEEEKRQKQLEQQQQKLGEAQQPTVFDREKTLPHNWFLETNLTGNKRMNSFDPEDSLLPPNAESLLPHKLLFDLESPDEEEVEPRRCPLRNYMNIPTFSNFQSFHPQLPQQQQQQQPQMGQQQQCNNTFFRSWLF